MAKCILVCLVGLMMPRSSWFRPWTPLAQQVVVQGFTPGVVYSQKRSIDYWDCSRPESLFSQKYGRGSQCEMNKQIRPASFAQSTSVITTTTQLRNSPSSPDGDPNSSSFRILTSAIGGLILFASSITLWSEWTVFHTSCGPLTLSDVLERTCYQVVLVTFSALWFARIAFQQDLMRSFYTNNIDRLQPVEKSQTTINNRRETSKEEGSSSGRASSSPIFLLLRFVEISVYICMMGAIIVLLNQATNNVDLLNAGLSGIDETMCRSKLGFFQESSSSLTTNH